jgi:phage FluMu gp28-like protein
LLAEESSRDDETFRREYMCEFGDMEGAVFSRESIDAALQDFEPLNL